MTDLVFVAGPPGAGKTSWVSAHIQPGDLVYDFDHLLAALTLAPLHTGRTEAAKSTVLAIRDVLGEHAARHPGRWWWITSAPLPDEREAWAAAGARVVVVIASLEECITRCAGRPPEQDWPAAIARWWRLYRPSPVDELVRTGGT